MRKASSSCRFEPSSFCLDSLRPAYIGDFWCPLCWPLAIWRRCSYDFDIDVDQRVPGARAENQELPRYGLCGTLTYACASIDIENDVSIDTDRREGSRSMEKHSTL